MTFHGGVQAEQLKQFIERIEKLEEEKKSLSDDIRDVYAESKAHGYDPKIIRQVVRIRKMDKNERDEQEHLLDVYKAALGLIPSFERQEGESELEAA
jgi:uncharacterized protein (UPF0335 family)